MYDKTMLNARLIEKQGLRATEIEQLCSLHDIREELFEAMKNLNPETDPRKLQQCALLVQDIEFRLQKAWKFPQDPNFHTWWFVTPHCTCPVLDNMDYAGSSLYATDHACPLHGNDTLWISSQENPTQADLSQTSPHAPFVFEASNATPWKAYFSLLNSLIQKCKKKFANWLA